MDQLNFDRIYDYPLTLGLCVLFTTNVILRWLTVSKKLSVPAKVMAVLGSGGHTRELLVIIENMPVGKFSPIVYVHSENDLLSVKKAELLENRRKNRHFAFKAIPRSRAVGQSYFTSIFTTLYSFMFSFFLVWQEKPDLIICTGPGVCVPIIYSAVFLKWLGLRMTGIVFIESICRVKTMSLSGKLVKPIVDEFIVQWEEMQDRFKGTKYIGRIC